MRPQIRAMSLGYFMLLASLVDGSWGCGGSVTTEPPAAAEFEIMGAADTAGTLGHTSVSAFVTSTSSALTAFPKSVSVVNDCTTTGDTVVCSCPGGGTSTTVFTSGTTTIGTCMDNGTVEPAESHLLRYTRTFDNCHVTSCGAPVTLTGVDYATVTLETNGSGILFPDGTPNFCHGESRRYINYHTTEEESEDPYNYCVGMNFTTASGTVIGGYGLNVSFTTTIFPDRPYLQGGPTGTICMNGISRVYLKSELRDACTGNSDDPCLTLYPIECDSTLGNFGNPDCASDQVCGPVVVDNLALLSFRCKPIVPCDSSQFIEGSDHQLYSEECRDLAPTTCPQSYDNGFCIELVEGHSEGTSCW